MWNNSGKLGYVYKYWLVFMLKKVCFELVKWVLVRVFENCNCFNFEYQWVWKGAKMGIPKFQKYKFEELCYPESTLLFAVVVLVSETCVVTVQCQKIFCY